MLPADPAPRMHDRAVHLRKFDPSHGADCYFGWPPWTAGAPSASALAVAPTTNSR